MKKKLTYIITLLVVAIIIVALNMIGTITLSGAKIDVTEEKLFTLDAGSRNIAASIEDPVTIRYFLSRTALSDQPGLREFGQRVLETLKSYRAASGDRITLEVIDPRPDTEEEEAAMRYDLQAVPVGQTGESIYMGLVMRDESGREATIRFLDPNKANLLEYEISQALYKLAHPELKKLGVISSLPVMGRTDPPQNPMMMQQQQSGQDPWFFIQQLQSTFDISEIPTEDTVIPPDTDLLMVIHPKNLSDETRYAIDQFVLAGGNALVFVDPLSEMDQMLQQQTADGNMQAMMQGEVESNMPDLLKAWGLQMVMSEGGQSFSGQTGPKPVVVADPTIAGQRMNPQTGEPEEMAATLILSEDEMNSEQIITNDLSQIVVSKAGALETVETDAEIETVVLLHTTDKAGTIDPLFLKLSPAGAPMDEVEGAGEEMALAFKVSGSFKSAFGDGAPEGVKTGRHLTESQQPATIVVVADTDLISDRYAYNVQNFFGRMVASPANGNSILAANAAENLTGSRDLISLRSRGMSDRRFEVVEKLLRDAQAEYRERLKELEEKERAISQDLRQLQQTNPDVGVLNTTVAQKRKELLAQQAETQSQLRDLRRNLREDVEKLGIWVKFINIGLMPFLVILAGLFVVAMRVMQRKRQRQAE
ncbi:MAG: GldG family protein [Candidatus Sumerlaeota bacterium]